MYVNALKVYTESKYNLQTNASGDGVADYVNKKRTVEVGIIALDSNALKNIMSVIEDFNVTLTFRNPRTEELESISCIIPDAEVEYYTIQADKVMYKAFTLTFTEL